MYSVRSDIGSASTISGDPTTALANGFSIRKVRDLFTVTTICRTAPLSSYGCAWARWRGPDPTPSSAEAMITGTKSKYRAREPLIRCSAIRRLSPCLLFITAPPVHFPLNGIGSPCTPRASCCWQSRDRYCGLEQAAHDQGLRALARFDHWPLIQVPTVPIVAITAMSRMPTSTVYSIKEAPSSSLPRRRSRFIVYDICHSSCVGRPQEHPSLRFPL